MSAMAIEDPWIAELEQQKVKADLMNWDLALEKYCAIERTIKAKQDIISSIKLEWLTQRHFGVSTAEECYLFLGKGIPIITLHSYCIIHLLKSGSMTPAYK